MARHGPLRLVAAPASVTSTAGPAVRYLERHPGRTISMTGERFDDTAYMIEGLRPNTNSLFDIRSIDGYDGGPQVRDTWIEAANALTKGKVDVALTLRSQAALPLDPDLYARFGVRSALVDTSVVPPSQFVPGWGEALVTSGSVQLFENPSYDGDAFVYHATRRVDRAPGKALRHMDASDLRSVAIVGPDGPRLRCATSCDRETAAVHRVTPEHIVVHADTDAPGLLALTEQADDGWRVEIDGHAAETVTVDGFMLGVRLPPGSHTVSFRFTAPGLHAGLVVSGLAAILVLVLLVDRRRRSEPARDDAATT